MTATTAGVAGSIERKLTTILAADMAAYSQWMERDEAGTLERLRAARATMKDLVTSHRGRVANTAGDSILAEFPSTVEAVSCAVDIQKELAARTEGNAPGEPLRFRIGVNLGDVMVEPDGDLFGDGVNVAARLQALAEPGGIIVSRIVKEIVQGKLELRFASKGEQHLKNIEQPVEAFALEIGGKHLFERVMPGRGDQQTKAARRSDLPVLAVAGVVVLGSFLLGHWMVWPGIVAFWIAASHVISRCVDDPGRRHLLHTGNVILGLALINLAGGGSEPWFLYPAIPLMLFALLSQLRRSRR